MEKLVEIKNFFLNNKLITLLFIFATVFFLYQHSLGIHWDFASYTLNAKYIFSDGHYFEWYRAPLTSFLIGIFTFFILPFWVAEYIYIIFVSFLFLYSCVKFSESSNLDKTLFYVLMLNPFVILMGLAVGTELLTLSFLLLFLSQLFKKTKIKSGVIFAFSVLARYSALPYSVLILLTKNLKENKKQIILFFVVIGAIFLPWFLFNYFHTGNFLTSIANSQAVNIKYRMSYLYQMPSLLDFIIVGNFLIPFFIVGLKRSNLNRKDISIIAFFLLTLIFYIYIPVKVPRYLFNLVLPLAYFSYFYLRKIKNTKLIFSALTIITIFGLIIFNMFTPLGFLNPPPKDFYSLGSQECMWASNQWVPLNYIDYTSKPFPRKKEVNDYINEGYKVVIYYGWEPDYSTNMSFLKSHPVIKETGNYIILGKKDKCKEFENVDSYYLQKLNKTISKLYNYSIETNPCRSIGLGLICDYFKFL